MTVRTPATDPIIIAIDGFSSSGKSTMARSLAAKLGYRYIDSGAMYRAVTLYALDHGMIADDGTIDTEALYKALPNIDIDFKLTDDGSQHTMLDGRDVERDIRSMRVAEYVSSIAALSPVRHRMVALQQRFGLQKGIVMDGRDIGTTVFPNAELKIFVNASAETRARRRWQELNAKGSTGDTSYDHVLANVKARDHQDMTRDESPLRQAEDAIPLDNSSMTPAEQDAWLIERVNNLFRH